MEDPTSIWLHLCRNNFPFKKYLISFTHMWFKKSDYDFLNEKSCYMISEVPPISKVNRCSENQNVYKNSAIRSTEFLKKVINKLNWQLHTSKVLYEPFHCQRPIGKLDRVYVENCFLHLGSYARNHIKALSPCFFFFPNSARSGRKDDTVQKKKSFWDSFGEKNSKELNFKQLKKKTQLKVNNARWKTVGKFNLSSIK